MEDYTVLDFLKTFGINTKTNFDLYDYSKFLNLEVEIIMNNEIEEVKDGSNKKNIIINIQNNNYKGTHWCCIYNKHFYFDSFGINPTKEVENYLNKDFIYNSLQVQPFETSICGILCLYVLYKLSKGNNDDNIVNKTAQFEEIIKVIHENFQNLL